MRSDQVIERYTSRRAFALLQQLYLLLTLQANFFRPVRKLVGKQRLGAKMIKRYDTPATPYQRLLAAGILSQPALATIEQHFLANSPAQLRDPIDELLRKLWRIRQAAQTPGEA